MWPSFPERIPIMLEPNLSMPPPKPAPIPKFISLKGLELPSRSPMLLAAPLLLMELKLGMLDYPEGWEGPSSRSESKSSSISSLYVLIRIINN